jgi:hypothetical protein
METPNTGSLSGWFAANEIGAPAIRDMFRTYNAGATAFRKESESHE